MLRLLSLRVTLKEGQVTKLRAVELPHGTIRPRMHVSQAVELPNGTIRPRMHVSQPFLADFNAATDSNISYYFDAI